MGGSLVGHAVELFAFKAGVNGKSLFIKLMDAGLVRSFVHGEAFGKVRDEDIGMVKLTRVRLNLVAESVETHGLTCIGNLLNKNGDLLSIFC